MKKTKREVARQLELELDDILKWFPDRKQLRKIKRADLIICLQRLGRIRNLLRLRRLI